MINIPTESSVNRLVEGHGDCEEKARTVDKIKLENVTTKDLHSAQEKRKQIDLVAEKLGKKVKFEDRYYAKKSNDEMNKENAN